MNMYCYKVAVVPLALLFQTASILRAKTGTERRGHRKQKSAYQLLILRSMLAY
jgi:hypothetical protein